ncbi:MAG TPA: hypothetical protein DCS93_02115 [Microscillaceae bacterium]|nr:hypothetical protein [Microscillaceae bacterium]
MKNILLLILIMIATSCNSQQKQQALVADQLRPTTQKNKQKGTQIGRYLVAIFEDSKGNMWFGTLEKGVAKYDGKTLRYFTMKDGLISNAVVSVAEDKKGNLWFGTQAGLSKYDGTSFTNYTTQDGLCNNNVSCLLIDSKSNLWIGTWGGVCQFDGNKFTRFSVPDPAVEIRSNAATKDWVTGLKEDSKGNIWLTRDGYGACKYDGKTFVHITEKEGLYSNNVQAIEEDTQGNIWFGTRVAEKDNAEVNKRAGKGGLIKFDSKNMTYYPKIKGLSQGDVYAIYRDASGNIWVSTTGHGVYKFDGKQFINYPVSNAANTASKAVMNILEDRKGNIWLGCAGGLFRLTPKGAVNITTEGPWK